MITEKKGILLFFTVGILNIFFGLFFLFLGYREIVPFNLDNILNDLIFISFGIIILVFLIKSDHIKYNWANGNVIYYFFFLLFSLLIILQIIKTIFLPIEKNIFILIFVIVTSFIFFKTINNLIGCFLKFHSISSKLIVEKIEELLNSKRYKYVKKGPQKASINNLMVFDERIYIKRFDIVINISSKGIIIGKIRTSNEKIIIWLMKSINRKIETVSK